MVYGNYFHLIVRAGYLQFSGAEYIRGMVNNQSQIERNKAMSRAAVATIVSTGERYHYDYRQSWGHTYYSFDRGDTWHRTRSAAYRAAKDADRLWRAED